VELCADRLKYDLAEVEALYDCLARIHGLNARDAPKSPRRRTPEEKVVDLTGAHRWSERHERREIVVNRPPVAMNDGEITANRSGSP